MNPFFQALNEGYSEDDILGYISKAIPKMSEPIRKASKMGYNTKEIIGYLSKVMNPSQRNLKGKSESAIHEMNAQEDAQRVKRGLTMAATAVAAPIAASAASNALSRALPNSLKNLPAGTIPNGVANAIPQSDGSPSNVVSGPNSNISKQQSNPIQNQIQNASSQPSINVEPKISQVTESIQPKEISNPKEVLEKMGVLKEVDDLLKRGNTPEQAAVTLGLTGKTKSKMAQSKVDPELQATIEAYSKEMSGQKQEQVPKNQEKIEEVIQVQEKPFEKGSSVITDHGIGDIKAIRNGKAIVEVDGKKHQINEEDLQAPEFSDDEIADTYEKLMSIIPEEHRSGFVSWAGYDEDRNVLGFIPRGGKYEELQNITPEEAKKIKEGTGIARTTGENKEGLWIAGEGTRGGVISQIIHDRKKNSKRNKEQQLEFDLDLPKAEKQDRGVKPLFDELSYARNISNSREKKIKEEERAKKKKERDETKKRKK